ncbi:winged helix-turn-helix transcriptional regulator [Nocardia seriolae]
MTKTRVRAVPSVQRSQIGRILRELRKASGVTNRDVCEATGLAP